MSCQNNFLAPKLSLISLCLPNDHSADEFAEATCFGTTMPSRPPPWGPGSMRNSYLLLIPYRSYSSTPYLTLFKLKWKVVSYRLGRASTFLDVRRMTTQRILLLSKRFHSWVSNPNQMSELGRMRIAWHRDGRSGGNKINILSSKPLTIDGPRTGSIPPLTLEIYSQNLFIALDPE